MGVHFTKNDWSLLGDPVRGDPDKRGSKCENCAFLHDSDPLKIQFKFEFILQKIDWCPWGDPVRSDPNKRGSKRFTE